MYDPLKERAKACLPPGAFLKLDRGDALYVANVPPAGGDFRAETHGRLLFLYLTQALLPVLEKSFAAPAQDLLYRDFCRFQNRPVSESELVAAGNFLKRRLMGLPCEEKPLRQTAAFCLRTHTGGALSLLRRIQIGETTDVR